MGRDKAGHAVGQKSLSAAVQGGGRALEVPLKSQQEASAQTGTTELVLKAPTAEVAKAREQSEGVGGLVDLVEGEDNDEAAADIVHVCLSSPNDWVEGVARRCGREEARSKGGCSGRAEAGMVASLAKEDQASRRLSWALQAALDRSRRKRKHRACSSHTSACLHHTSSFVPCMCDSQSWCGC